MSEPVALTREHLKALRGAKSIVFRYYTPACSYAPEGITEPLALIDAKKEINPDDGYGPRDLHAEIPLNGVSIHNWDRNDDMWDVSDFSWVFLYNHYDQPLGTLIHGGILRVGDRLSVKLNIGNNSENIRNAKLTKDEIFLVVDRGPLDDRSKCKRLVFMLDDALYPPYSAGRNVRFLPRQSEYTLTKEA